MAGFKAALALALCVAVASFNAAQAADMPKVAAASAKGGYGYASGHTGPTGPAGPLACPANRIYKVNGVPTGAGTKIEATCQPGDIKIGGVCDIDCVDPADFVDVKLSTTGSQLITTIQATQVCADVEATAPASACVVTSTVVCCRITASQDYALPAATYKSGY